MFADLIGTPFKYGGRGNGAYDCYGLVMELHKRKGITLPDYLSPTDKGIIASMMASQITLWEKVDQPRPGDVILFRIGRFNCHVGVLISDFEFIHTYEASGGVCTEYLSSWDRRIEGYYRYAGN